jgi:chemotaxis response regulator CheB
MAGKGKKENPPEKKGVQKGRSQVCRRNAHLEQRQAEEEETRTLKKHVPEEPDVSQSGAPDESAPEQENEKDLAAEGSSRKAMEEGLFPIVGLGASAGGLPAIEAFFDAVSEDSGLAFVVITHTHL